MKVLCCNRSNRRQRSRKSTWNKCFNDKALRHSKMTISSSEFRSYLLAALSTFTKYRKKEPTKNAVRCFWNIYIEIRRNFFFLFEFITVARSSMEISKANFIQNVDWFGPLSRFHHLQSFLLFLERNIENASLHVNVLFLVVCECFSFLCYCVHFISLWLSFRLMYTRDLLHTVNHASFKPYVKPKVNSHIM